MNFTQGAQGFWEDAEMKENEIGTIIVETSAELHKKLGPGLLESVYEVILMKSLSKKGLFVQQLVIFLILEQC